MSDHSTPEFRTRVHAADPSSTDTPGTVLATFADIVCADHGLLRAEFDALITANHPRRRARRRLLPPRHGLVICPVGSAFGPCWATPSRGGGGVAPPERPLTTRVGAHERGPPVRTIA
jgi:hypothetical protein